MQAYTVGQQILPPGLQGVRFQMDDSGGVLQFLFDRPTPREIREFKSGISIQFCVVDQIIFILARLGASQWMDAPYYRKLSPGLTRLDWPNDGEGLAITCMLVDSSTGVLKALKLRSLTTRATHLLMAAIAAQPEIPDYDQRLRRVFAQYTTNDLVREAESLC